MLHGKGERHLGPDPAHALQDLPDRLLLDAQAFLIAHMQSAAAPADFVVRAGRGHPLRAFLQDGKDPGEGEALFTARGGGLNLLPRKGAGDEHGLPVHMGDALHVAVHAFDLNGECLIFLQHGCFLPKTPCFSARRLI
jgi:hypothetical protein